LAWLLAFFYLILRILLIPVKTIVWQLGVQNSEHLELLKTGID